MVDHQTGLLSLVRDIDPDKFKNNTQQAAWTRLEQEGAQIMTWFGAACELHRDWRNDIEGLGTLFSNHIPDYRNLMNSYSTLTAASK
ncbi:hypothetical protein PT7_0403 [Pusillimonas sp. T7-7]|nr:hypothetical protein PT7_0403 [Pusillimonas sp. T7-7]